MTTITQNQAISRLRVPERDELNERTAKLQAATEQQEGYLPNWLAAFALGGDHFSRLGEYLFPLLADGKGTLTHREREIIATVVSVANGCSYCHTQHVHSLGELLGDHWLAARIGLDHREVAEISDREHALAALALTITRQPREVSDAQLDELRAHGLSDEDVFEAIQVASIINATNRITLALGVLPDKEIFAR
jgi:uncharacterized peroxidase-related enzyme